MKLAMSYLHQPVVMSLARGVMQLLPCPVNVSHDRSPDLHTPLNPVPGGPGMQLLPFAQSLLELQGVPSLPGVVPGTVQIEVLESHSYGGIHWNGLSEVSVEHCVVAN